MEQLSSRLLKWRTQTGERLRRSWWVFLLVLAWGFAQELAKDRIVHGTNEFIDSHAGSWLRFLQPAATYLLSRPVSAMLCLLAFALLVLLIHAYVETRPTVADATEPRATAPFTAVQRLESTTSRFEDPTLGSRAVQESVSATTRESRERVCVAPEVNAHYLLDLFKKNTSAQAKAIARPYFGKWMRLVAVVTDVNDVTYRQEERRTMVHAAVLRTTKGKKPEAADVVLTFNGPWSEKALLLPAGAKIKVFGRIDDTNWKYVGFDDCELE